MASPIKFAAGVVGTVGLVVTLGTGYLVVRGPFLGRAMLAPRPLLAALGAFVVGVTLTVWGLTRYARA